MTLYKYGLFLTLQTCFKAIRALLGPKQTISIQLGAGCYKMISESIPDLGVVVCLAQYGCLFVQPRNPVGHNEDVVSAWGVFVTSHIGQKRKFLALYKYRLFVTLQMRYKAVRVPLGTKQTISTRLRAGHYKQYQSRSLTSVWWFVWPHRGVRLFGPAILWNTMRTLCLYGGSL